MRRLLKWTSILIGLAAIFLAVVGWRFLHVPTNEEARLAAIQKQAQKGVDKGYWPGLMWGIVREGDVVSVGAAGWADIGAKVPMTPDTTMPVGSITKVLAGLTGAQLIEDGRLDPNAPISTLLSIPFDPPDGAKRTFAHLTSHTAGILDADIAYEEIGYYYGSTKHPDSLTGFLTRYFDKDGDLFNPENFADWRPGTRYEYSNIGAGLAGQVMTDVSGKDYADLSREMVIDPLGLSGFWGHQGPPGDKKVAQATLYDRDENGAFKALQPYALATWPDGQFNASARDLSRLLAVMMSNGVLDGERLLPEAAIQRQKAPAFTDKEIAGDYIGMFWERETMEIGPLKMVVEGHSGGDPGVVTFMHTVEGRPNGVVLMLNGAPNNHASLLAIVRMARLLAGPANSSR